MVEKFDVGVGRVTLRRGNFQPMANRLLRHRLMRAQRNEHVESPGDLPNLAMQRLKYQPHRRGARAIRNDDQHLSTAIILRRASLSQHISNLLKRYVAPRRSHVCEIVLCTFRI